MWRKFWSKFLCLEGNIRLYLHICGLAPLWICIWSSQWLFCLNVLPGHLSHLFSSEWTHLWTSSAFSVSYLEARTMVDIINVKPEKELSQAHSIIASCISDKSNRIGSVYLFVCQSSYNWPISCKDSKFGMQMYLDQICDQSDDQDQTNSLCLPWFSIIELLFHQDCRQLYFHMMESILASKPFSTEWMKQLDVVVSPPAFLWDPYLTWPVWPLTLIFVAFNL